MKQILIVVVVIIVLILALIIYISIRTSDTAFSINQTEVEAIPLGNVNAYVIKGTKNILVDTGNPGNEKAILDALSGMGMKPEEISLIVITHGHSDHFGSVWALKQKTGAKVAIHKLDADSIRTGTNPPLYPRSLFSTITTWFISSKVEGFHVFEPDILIDEKGMPLNDYGVDGSILCTPGHTPGSISVVLNSGLVIAGDTFSGGTKYAQFTSLVFDEKQIISSGKAVMAVAPKIVYAGHGGPISPDAIGKLLLEAG